MWIQYFDRHLLEKFRETNMVVKMAPLSLRLALNFFKQSTVSWRWTMLATRSRCCSSKEKIVSRAFWPASRLVAFFIELNTYTDPGVLERLIGTDPLWGIDCQHLVDEIFGLRSDSVPLRGRVIIGASLDLGIKSMLIFIPKGRVTD